MAEVIPVPSPFGRGRGRGRGLRASSLTKPGPSASTQSIVPKANLPETVCSKESKVETERLSKDLPTAKVIESSTLNTTSQNCNDTECTAVKDILKRMDELTVSEIMKTIVPEIELLKEKKTIEVLVKALSEKALSDASFAVIAAEVIKKIWDNESLHSFIRNPLLQEIQSNYKNRNELRKVNQFYGSCVYICELFKHLRLKNKPLQPIGKAVVVLLKELLENKDKPSDEDLFYFYQELESAGKVVEECLPGEMEEVINIARQMVISSSLIPSMRCRLVQLIELHAAKWQMKDELKVMYDDLQQDLMSEGK